MGLFQVLQMCLLGSSPIYKQYQEYWQYIKYKYYKQLINWTVNWSVSCDVLENITKAFHCTHKRFMQYINMVGQSWRWIWGCSLEYFKKKTSTKNIFYLEVEYSSVNLDHVIYFNQLCVFANVNVKDNKHPSDLDFP
jgi:hypothetical protein